MLQDEPDHLPEASSAHSRLCSRSQRNAERERRGQQPVPLRYLESGAANPDYQPETLADVTDPPAAMRHLLLRGPTIPREAANVVEATLTTDLGGLHPRDGYLEFYRDGIYRRLLKDQERSNALQPRYRWIEAALGPVDEHGFILTDDQVDALKKLRDERQKPPRSQQLPLAGLFAMAPPAHLYTRHGWLAGSEAVWRWRTSHNTTAEAAGYRIYYEPPHATPHGSDCIIVGWVPD